MRTEDRKDTVFGRKMLLLPELPEMKDPTEEAVCAVEDGFIHKTVRGGVMKNGMWFLLLVTILLLKNRATDAQPPDFLWAAQAGGAAHWDIAYAIATDSSDNSIVTGCFYDTATFGDTTLVSAGEYDIFVAKLGAGGTRIEGEFVRPRSFELLQNRPNPFNSATLLRFRTAESGMVNLKVYDVSGREVRTLVDEWRQPGSHTVLWDGRTGRATSTSSNRLLSITALPSTR